MSDFFNVDGDKELENSSSEEDFNDLPKENNADVFNGYNSESNSDFLEESGEGDSFENSQEEFDSEDNSENGGGDLSQKEEKKGSGMASTVILAILCVLVIFVKFIWFDCVQVEGDSMNNTLQTGDYLLMDKLAGVDRGDVIVFTRENKAYIKRVVALEGDTVKISNGNLYVCKSGETNFELVEYQGVKGKTYYLRDPAKEFTRTVSKDCFFVLGDNRENSTDSRMLGEIKKEEVDGVVHQFIIDNKDDKLGKIYKYI